MKENITISFGLDDTDSNKGMCTTYVMYKILEKARTEGFQLVGMPRLVRLNPAVPFKTRGNAALGADIALQDKDVERFKEIVLDTIFDLAEINEKKTNPAFVILNKEKINETLVNFSRAAVKNLLPVTQAVDLLKKFSEFFFGFNGSQGLVGALAGAAYDFPSGYTYELLAYRVKEMRGKKRLVESNSVLLMDAATSGCTFDNYDYENEEVKITPHTPCPVLLGIRGLKVECLEKAFKMLKIDEPVEGYIIYKTNQATDDHIVEIKILDEIMPLTSVSFQGKVVSLPKEVPGGHVFVEVSDGIRKIRIASYEPTRSLRKIVLSLRPGDEVRVWGSYKPKQGEPPTINLEKIKVVNVYPYGKLLNPICPVCGTRMKSEGKGKGFQCPRCKFRIPKAEKVLEIERRDLVPGFYDVPPKARRHLSRPSFLRVIKDEK